MTITPQHAIIMAALFLFGQALHVLARANLSTRSQLTATTRMRDYLSLNWPTILIRWVLETFGMLAWLNSNMDFNAIPGVQVPTVVGRLLPITWLTAPIYGYFSDSLVDKIFARFAPSTQKELPALPVAESPEKGGAN